MGDVQVVNESLNANSVLFILSTIWWLDYLGKILFDYLGNAFEQKKKKRGLNLTLG